MPTPTQEIEKKLEQQSGKSGFESEIVTKKELDERDDKTPVLKEHIKYTEEQIKRLKTEVFAHYDAVEEERKANNFYDELDTLDAQNNGEMDDSADLEFNQNVPITQVKVDSLGRLALKAYLESDPKYSVTPRPQFARKDQWNVIVNRQTDYLDYKLDEEIKIESPLRKSIHQAILYPVGIVKATYKYLTRKRRREESYSGRVEINPETKKLYSPGLESFVRQHPEAQVPGNENYYLFKQLLERKDITFKSRFDDLVYDDPYFSFVDIRDFFVYADTEGYDGLCESRIYIERQRGWTWWQLKKAEHAGDFENVDAVKDRTNKDDTASVKPEKDDKGKGDYRTWDYTILEATYCFNEKSDPDDIDKSSDNPETENRIKCWFDVDSKAFLGAISYPYDTVDSDYIPFYVEDKKPGFYKGEFAKKLTSSHLTQNAILNLMLTEAWQQLMTTPIVRDGSPIIDQFLNKRWKPGVPLIAPLGSDSLEGSMKFLDRPQRAVAQQLIPVLVYMSRQDDLRTGMNEASTSGQTDPTDPESPAKKTAMLLRQSGINISDYINCMLPAFNLIGEIILQLTYQMTKDKGVRGYRQKHLQGKVVGGEIFEQISRDEMVAKTNIQSRAAGFDFDKLNEKRETLALFQLLYPILSQTGLGTPQGVYALVRTLCMTWSPLWKNKVDQILVDPATFQQGQLELGVKSLVIYLQQMKQKQETTGVEQKADFGEYIKMATQMMKDAVRIPEENKK